MQSWNVCNIYCLFFSPCWPWHPTTDTWLHFMKWVKSSLCLLCSINNGATKVTIAMWIWPTNQSTLSMWHISKMLTFGQGTCIKTGRIMLPNMQLQSVAINSNQKDRKNISMHSLSIDPYTILKWYITNDRSAIHCIMTIESSLILDFVSLHHFLSMELSSRSLFTY